MRDIGDRFPRIWEALALTRAALEDIAGAVAPGGDAADDVAEDAFGPADDRPLRLSAFR